MYLFLFFSFFVFFPQTEQRGLCAETDGEKERTKQRTFSSHLRVLITLVLKNGFISFTLHRMLILSDHMSLTQGPIRTEG